MARDRAWGYLFKYLCFYQLDEGETLVALMSIGMLTSNDWGVLNLLIPCYLEGSNGMTDGDSKPRPSKQSHLTLEGRFAEFQRKNVFIWQSKTSPFHATF